MGFGIVGRDAGESIYGKGYVTKLGVNVKAACGGVTGLWFLQDGSM